MKNPWLLNPAQPSVLLQHASISATVMFECFRPAQRGQQPAGRVEADRWRAEAGQCAYDPDDARAQQEIARMLCPARYHARHPNQGSRVCAKFLSSMIFRQIKIRYRLSCGTAGRPGDGA